MKKHNSLPCENIDQRVDRRTRNITALMGCDLFRRMTFRDAKEFLNWADGCPCIGEQALSYWLLLKRPNPILMTSN